MYRNPDFVKYFRICTPEAELGKLNIGSRPTRRKPADAGVGSLRAIPWIFAWTQTRHVLPSWLGVGEALEAAMPQHRNTLREMLRDWPFFSSMISLVEMTLAKADMNVARYYDKVRTADQVLSSLPAPVVAAASVWSVCLLGGDQGHRCGNQGSVRILP